MCVPSTTTVFPLFCFRQIYRAMQVLKFRTLMEEQGLLDSRRRQQAAHWMNRHLKQQLMDRAVADAQVQTLAA